MCCLISATTWAAIGTVAETKGSTCEIHRAKNKLPGTKGASIESMDTFVTGNCVGSITFKDDTKVKVTENSRLLIDDFVFDPKKSDAGKLAVKVTLGTVRYASGQIAKTNPQNVNIKTPTATVAVRGTDFNMTVDEAGQSLVILVPSCKDESEVKQYELQENRCKVGKIDVITLAGSVTLDRAFEATYVVSSSMPPSPPVVINTVEGKINNSLIISKPPEVQRVSKDSGKKKDSEQEELEAEQARQITQRMKDGKDETKTVVTPYTFDTGKAGCNPATSICVIYEKPDEETLQMKGKGTAFRSNSDHYAEVKTQGYDSNHTITITHDDVPAFAVIGSGDVGGNVVNIKQSTGVLKK